jgi:hypothetical protein
MAPAHRGNASLHHAISAGRDVDDVNSVVGKGAGHLAVVIDAEPARQQIVAVQANTEQPPRAELGSHYTNYLKKKAKPVFEIATVSVGTGVGRRREKGVG